MRPQYQKIKQFIREHIDNGEWTAGYRVSSDNVLATQFGVSRMTANRAMRELTDAGILTRITGVGTFVAKHVPQTPLFEIKNIAEEIESRGNHYSAVLHTLIEEPASQQAALELQIPVKTPIYHSLLVHCENGIPVQLEDRFVNPAQVPQYINQDFCRITPNAYLTEAAPLTEVEQIIEAILPDALTQQLLSIGADQPCLLIYRRTWAGPLVSSARLTHPGNRYRMGGRFVPDRKPIPQGKADAR